MKRLFTLSLLVIALLTNAIETRAQERRPIDSEHPLWLVHVDVWNKADPQKIIDLIPQDIRPYVCMNLSLSCQYDKEKDVYKMPQNAIRTYKSWASICQQNGMWFCCQPASGGHTHIQDYDLETFEYFYRTYPNFLGWNYAEQFWGFDEAGDKSSSTQTSRIALFAKLVEMAHQYGGFLTISFCGNIWSHPLNPIGMMKRNSDLLAACKKYPEAILWLYKYTTSSCFYNNESVTWGPFVSGLAKNYGVRYDNCGWNGALDDILGKDHGKKYPVAAGIGTVMEQTGRNGGAVWDGPELIWTEDFQEIAQTNVGGYQRRNWDVYPGFKNAWLDMWSKVIDGTLHIPSREEVLEQTHFIIVNDVTSGNDEDKYATWGDLYDNLYKQTDPFNKGNGQWMNNYCYFKSTGRFGAVPMTLELNDDLAKAIPNQVKKSKRTTTWSSLTVKANKWKQAYPEISTGDLFVTRIKNQLVTYTPYTYVNSKTSAKANVPLQYNTCESLDLNWGKLSSGLIREYDDSITVYLNNYRTDTTTLMVDEIRVNGVAGTPSYTAKRRANAAMTTTEEWNEADSTWTITVKHRGPVDLVLRCSGLGTDRRTDVASNTPLALPRQPEPFRGAIIIEAEDMDWKSIKSCCVDPYGRYPNVRGHAGNGFMDMGTNTAGGLKCVVKAPEAGTYKLAVRYTNTTKAGNLTVKVGTTSHLMKCEKTETNQWLKATAEYELKEGNNNVYINNTAGLNMYIDQLIVTPADLPAERFLVTVRDAEHGTAVASVSEAEEGETVTLTATPEEGWNLVGWNILHGDIVIAEDGTFTMTDDNVTVQPIYADATAVYKLDMSQVLSGNMPQGWRAVDNGDVHEYPNGYGSGPRTFAGFAGTWDKALYWRVSYADYGMQSAYRLHLQPGTYKLTWNMAAWKGTPKCKGMITTTAGKVIAQSSFYSATPNANGNFNANLSSAPERSLEVKITEEGDYVIKFMNNGTGFDEFLLTNCRLGIVESGEDAINAIEADNLQQPGTEIYALDGRRLTRLQKGVNIIRRQGVEVKKIYVK